MIEAVVKSVLSADTLILAHPSKLPPVEKMVTLTNINAPRYARKAGDKEEPFAFLAREYVRQRCIGKKILFDISYTNPKTGRDFGHVYVGGQDIEHNLGYQLLERGYATLVKTRSDGTDIHEYMLEAFENAHQAGLGIHSQDQKVIQANTRVPKWDNINLKELVKKSSPVKGVVENVLSGSTVVVQLADTFENVLLHMTGIRCPRIRYKNVQEVAPDGRIVTVKRPDPEPMAQEAKHFTEVRLLNRDVEIYIDGARDDKQEKALIGSLLALPNANSTSTQNEGASSKIHQEELLERGFARYVDFEAYCSRFSSQMIAAEKIAKSKKLRVWKDYEPPESSLLKEDKDLIRARVIEILSGDKIRVRYENGTDELISLSCVRAPSMGTKNAQPEPWAIDAKDKLRAIISGNPVTIKIDYRKSMKVNKESQEPTTEDRKFATVRLHGKNVIVPLVKAGLVSVLNRKIDEERSDDYGELKELERIAIAGKKGIHGNPKNAPKYHINDLSYKTLGDVQKFAHLLLGKKVKAVVEKVHAVHRFKLYIPQEHCKITFTLSGVSAPSLKSDDTEEKKYAEEGLSYAIDHLLLRDIEVEIQSVNNVGNFLGTLFVKGKDNYVYDLIKEGYVEVRKGGFVDKLPNAHLLKKAEAEAQINQKRLYKNWMERQGKGHNADEDEVEEAKSSKKKDTQENSVIVHNERSSLHCIRATEIVDSNHLYMQTSDASEFIPKIESLMNQLNLDQKSEWNSPKNGVLCFAKFSYDEQWYRAKVTKVNSKNSTAMVVYIDYGNSEEVPFSNIRAVENNPITKELARIPPQVREVYLAFVGRVTEEYEEEALEFLSEKILEKDLYARLEYEDNTPTPHKQYITLFLHRDATRPIQEELIEQGYATVNIPEYLQKREYGDWLRSRIDELMRAEDNAKTFRKGIWEKSF